MIHRREDFHTLTSKPETNFKILWTLTHSQVQTEGISKICFIQISLSLPGRDLSRRQQCCLDTWAEDNIEGINCLQSKGQGAILEAKRTMLVVNIQDHPVSDVKETNVPSWMSNDRTLRKLGWACACIHGGTKKTLHDLCRDAALPRLDRSFQMRYCYQILYAPYYREGGLIIEH